MARLNRSPCLGCPQRQGSKFKCAPTCGKLKVFQENIAKAELGVATEIEETSCSSIKRISLKIPMGGLYPR